MSLLAPPLVCSGVAEIEMGELMYLTSHFSPEPDQPASEDIHTRILDFPERAFSATAAAFLGAAAEGLSLRFLSFF